MNVRSYRELEVWKLGMRLAHYVCLLSKAFPVEERFGLVVQMRRAAVSVPANIAEGHARESTREFLRYLLIARGSLAEVETYVQLAEDLGYCAATSAQEILGLCDREGRMLRGLQKALKARAGRATQAAVAPAPRPSPPIPLS